MSTEVTNYNYQELAELSGMNTREPSVILPVLSVNRIGETEDGKQLPLGQFTVTQNEVQVFSPTAIFRPFINAFQYIEYSPTEKKYTNRSVIIKKFQEEALDMKGGLKCGKIPFKDLKEASEDVVKVQKNIRCRRHLYGLLTFPSAKSTVVNLPVLWRMTGGQFMAPDEALKSIEKMKHLYFQHSLNLAIKREKISSTVMAYNILVEPNLKDTIEFTSDNMETFSMFQEIISRENNYIAKCWREAKKDAVKAEMVDYLSELDLNDSIDDLN